MVRFCFLHDIIIIIENSWWTVIIIHIFKVIWTGYICPLIGLMIRIFDRKFVKGLII